MNDFELILREQEWVRCTTYISKKKFICEVFETYVDPYSKNGYIHGEDNRHSLRLSVPFLLKCQQEAAKVKLPMRIPVLLNLLKDYYVTSTVQNTGRSIP